MSLEQSQEHGLPIRLGISSKGSKELQRLCSKGKEKEREKFLRGCGGHARNSQIMQNPDQESRRCPEGHLSAERNDSDELAVPGILVEGELPELS